MLQARTALNGYLESNALLTVADSYSAIPFSACSYAQFYQATVWLPRLLGKLVP